MKERRWKNQYIDLIAQNQDQIFTLTSPEQIAETCSTVKELTKLYDALVVELGSGSGGHLIAHAQNNPTTLFLGIELRFKRAYRTIEKAKNLELTNIRMVQGDARTIIELFDDQSIDEIYVNFPDPWAKRRWKKHRILTNDFLIEIHKKLAPGGVFSHKTDHLEYFEETLDLLQKIPAAEILQLSYNLHTNQWAQQLERSEFENLFTSQGLPVYFVATKKT